MPGTSSLQRSLILLIFAHLLLASALPGEGSGQQAASGLELPQQPAVGAEASLADAPRASGIADADDGDKPVNTTSGDAASEQLAQPEAVGAADQTKSNSTTDGSETPQNSSSESSSETAHPTLASTPITSASSTPRVTSNASASTESITEAQSVTEVSEPGVLVETRPEVSANSTSNNNGTAKAEAMDAARKAELAAAKPEDMSSGAVALVMAIVFAVVVVLVYVGLLGWRRYLEYRYGNRELLVNDLEFDTSDLRHFEL